MNGESPFVGLLLILIIAVLVIVALQANRRQNAGSPLQEPSEPSEPKPETPPAPVELTPAQKAEIKNREEEAAWAVSERERAAAWRDWGQKRDDAVAALKRDLAAGEAGGLFRIERSEDNIYRVQRRQFHVRALPEDGVDLSNDTIEAYVRYGSRQFYRGWDVDEYSNQARRDRERGLWPDVRDFYREEWAPINTLTFSQLREAEQWLDDYLNPTGRRWTYDAFGVKVAEEAETTPVEPLESHFHQERDPDIYALARNEKFLAIPPAEILFSGARAVRNLLRAPFERAALPDANSGSDTLETCEVGVATILPPAEVIEMDEDDVRLHPIPRPNRPRSKAKPRDRS